MRLIDADALPLDSIDMSDLTHESSITVVRFEDIQNAPTIDIVRCKECKWRNIFGCHNPIWGDGWANYPSPSPREDDFCSYGERKESE